MERSIKTILSRGWWIALLLVIVAGYTIGKDRALRDNRQDQLSRTALEG